MSLVPGGTITYENRNLFGNAASVAASVNTKNFLAPADDLSFRVQFSQASGPGYQQADVMWLARVRVSEPAPPRAHRRPAAIHVRPGRPQTHPPHCLALQRPQGLRRVHPRCAVLVTQRDAVQFMPPLHLPCAPLPRAHALHANEPRFACPVGPGGDEVPAVWVDRTGAKVGITEQYSRNSKGTLAVVAQVCCMCCFSRHSIGCRALFHGTAVVLLAGRACNVLRCAAQEITTRDETGAPCTRGMRTTPFGQYVADGPPTGLSGAAPAHLAAWMRECQAADLAQHAFLPPSSLLARLPADKGVDRVLSAQGALTRDTTYLVNGAQVGARDILTVGATPQPPACQPSAARCMCPRG